MQWTPGRTHHPFTSQNSDLSRFPMMIIQITPFFTLLYVTFGGKNGQRDIIRRQNLPDGRISGERCGSANMKLTVQSGTHTRSSKL